MTEGTGHDPFTAQRVEIFHEIHVELVGVRAALDDRNTRLEALREEVHGELGALRSDVTDIRNELRGLRVELRAVAEVSEVSEVSEAASAR